MLIPGGARLGVRTCCLALMMALACVGPGQAQPPEDSDSRIPTDRNPPVRVITPLEGARQTPLSPAARASESTLLSLGLVLALLFATLVAIQKFVRRPAAQEGTGLLEVLDRHSLDARHQVYLLRCGDRILVLGVSPQGLATLANLEPNSEWLTQSRPSPTGAPAIRPVLRATSAWLEWAQTAVGGRAA